MSIAIMAAWGEVRREFRTFWTYRANVLTGMLSLYVIFVGFTFMLGRGEMHPADLATALLGYVAWFLMNQVLQNVGQGIRWAAVGGTLEQMCLSPAPLGFILMGRTVANLMITLLFVALLSAILKLAHGVGVPMSLAGIPVCVLIILGVYGFGYLIGGMVLIYKQMESLTSLLSNGMLFLNGTLLPVALMPPWLAAVARALPSTQGVIVLRKVVLESQTLGAAWADGSLVWLLVHSLLLLTSGIVVFTWCQHIAQRNGSMGQY
jgi:ABC-2 type transport system permease protein